MAAARRRRERAAIAQICQRRAVHGSGDAANAALMQHDGGNRCAGMMVALERIRVHDEIRWAYGWSADMWREVIDGAQPSHAPTAPLNPDSRNALLISAGTPADVQELLDDEGSSIHEQPRAAANGKSVTWTATIENLITSGRINGKLQLRKPGDLNITRPHAAGNPFTRRLKCTSSDCRNPLTHSSLCDTCRVAVCDGYEQLASEQADVAGHETTVRDIGTVRGLAVHSDYADQDASTLRTALQKCTTAINAGQPVRLLCVCPMNMRCHRDTAHGSECCTWRAHHRQRSSPASRHGSRQCSEMRPRTPSAARGPRVRCRQALRHGPSAILAGARRQRATLDGCRGGRMRAEWRQQKHQQMQ